MACILLVEDNDFIREALAGYLQLDEHKVIEFAEIRGVMEVINRGIVDLAILDVMLPDGNGFNLAKSIREVSDMPLVFLTAKDSESDRITGFELGADDYIVKPFSSKELALRIQALLKRCNRQQENQVAPRSIWRLGDQVLEMDKDTHRIVVNQQELYLTGAEWKILQYLAERENVVVSRERILSDCLNYFFEGSERTIDTHIANLRSKLGNGEWIGTVRGFGYRFNGCSQNGNANASASKVSGASDNNPGKAGEKV